jgi:hypothetical protein
MADSKISNLPNLVTPLVSDVLPIVNSGVAKKVSVQNLGNVISTPQGASAYTTVNANSASWVSPAAAFFATQGGAVITQDVDTTLNFDRTYYNTDTNVFELVNPGTSTARVQIKTPGVYRFTAHVHSYDITSNRDTSIKILSTGTSEGAMSFITLLHEDGHGEDSTDNTDKILQGTASFNLSPSFIAFQVLLKRGNGYWSTEDNVPASRVYIERINL